MHRICGVLVGTLPQCPQQNLFLGLPLELMAEEARLLVDNGLAFIVDDRMRHKDGIRQLRDLDRRTFLDDLDQEGRRAAEKQIEKKADKRLESLRKMASEKQTLPSPAPSTESFSDSTSVVSREDSIHSFFTAQDGSEGGDHPSAVSAAAPTRTSETNSRSEIVPLKITPATTSNILLVQNDDSSDAVLVPPTPPSYPLYRHLNSLGYFLSPGLRFGCQYMAYPGDPVRFHSHFLVTSAGWDEELDLMDLVTGGRLGTGVKKGFLIGGENEEQGAVRTFSLEWAGM